MKANNQLTAVAMALAAPLALVGKISDMMSQGIGPQPIENPTMYRIRLTRDSQVRLVSSPGAEGVVVEFAKK